MAILQEANSKSNNPFLEQVKDDVAPAGTWVATIIDIRDQFGVVRPNFDNPQQTEVVDLTTVLFGFRDQQGAAAQAQKQLNEQIIQEKEKIRKQVEEANELKFATLQKQLEDQKKLTEEKKRKRSKK